MRGKQGVSIEFKTSLSNLDKAFEDEEVDDENDEDQRQHRIQSLKNQSNFWKNCLDKQNIKSASNSMWQSNIFKECRSRAGDSSPEDFVGYYRKYNGGLSAKLILFNNESTDVDQPNGESNKDIQKKFHSPRRIDERKPRANTFNNVSRQRARSREFYMDKQGQNENSHFSQGSFEEIEDDQPTPCDEEGHQLAENMKFHSSNKQKQSQVNSNISDKKSNKKQSIQPAEKDNQQKKPSSSAARNQLIQLYELETPENEDTPDDFQEHKDPNANSDNHNQVSAYKQQQEFLKKQAEGQEKMAELNDSLQQEAQFKKKKNEISANQSNVPSKISSIQGQQNSSVEHHRNEEMGQKMQQGLSVPSVREILMKSNTEGYEEITNSQRLYFESQKFKDLLTHEIIPALHVHQDILDNDRYLVCLKDPKWNRIYLKQLNMYVQLRIFQSKSTYSTYLESYKKIVSKFIKFMPSTVYSDEVGFVIIQKLGDFSLYDLSNLILIEAKSHSNLNYSKYYMQMLSNLFDSLMTILSNNYYVGNIASKNIFVSKVPDSKPLEFIVKFSNLVDFSFNYNDVADPTYACIFKNKPTDMEIWFSELFACCRCMQEMIERDKYYFEKKNIKEFLNKYKSKYPRVINVLQYFLIGSDISKNGVNLDVITQFVLGSFENDSEKQISLSEKSVKHIQLMIQTSKFHLTPESYDLSDKSVEQMMYFFLQQLNYHQGFEDAELKYAMKFVNRMFYCHLLQKPSESDLIYSMLETLLSDALIFRRDKNLQKSTYILNVLFLMKNPAKIEKSISYWRYLNQTTSLVEIQNPVSLYYIGLFNMYHLDAQKSSKYFAHSFESKDFYDDILPQEPQKKQQQGMNGRGRFYYEDDEDDDFGEENYDIPRFKSKQKHNPVVSNKPKVVNSKRKFVHWLYSSVCESDKYISLLREAFGYLGWLKYVFLQENSIKRLEQIIMETKKFRVYKMVVKVIAFELTQTANLKSFILERHKVRETIIFVDSIANGQNFSENSFTQTAKTITNQITLIENLKRQIQSTYAQEPIFLSLANLFSAQVEVQSIIVEFVAREKRILNYSPDKHRARTFNSFHHIDY